VAKKKHNISNTPRRKRYSRKDRLQNAKKWMEQYNGKHLAKGYSNWFGVDLICAITELEMLGHKFKQSYKDKVKKSLEARQKHNEIRKQEKEQNEDFEEDLFYFVAGYTENGVPYGLTREEMEKVDEYPIILTSQRWKYSCNIDDDDLPF
jgi:hypothetical protein